MVYWKGMRGIVFCGILCFCLMWSAVKLTFSAVDYEETILPSSALHQDILQETIGFLVVKGEAPCRQESFQTYQYVDGTFVPFTMMNFPAFVSIIQRIVEDFSVIEVFPLTSQKGDYREIVHEPSENARVWINFVEVTTLFASCERVHGAGLGASVSEHYVLGEYTMLDEEALQDAIIYQSYENSWSLKSLRVSMKSPWNVFINQFHHAAAELWVDHERQYSRLGWLRFFDDDGHLSNVWSLDHPWLGAVDPFFLAEAIVVYDFPSEQAPMQTLSRREIEESLSICQRKDGFALLCTGQFWGEADCSSPLQSIGWVKLRDDQKRLTIWPRILWLC